MNKKLENYLYKTYPDILGDVYIGCGDGWFLIIDALCSQLQGFYVSAILGKDKTCPKAVQIKEKFGTLRFYLDPLEGERTYYEACYAAVNMAERLSRSTCESCGRPSYPSGEFRIKNFCPWCQSDARETFREEWIRECENYIEAKTKDEEFN